MADASQSAEASDPRYLTGPPIKHVATLAAAGATGLLALFFVDLANMFYISLLGNDVYEAAIGYASIIVFANISICIGMMIAAVSAVSRAIGAKDRDRARRLAGVSLVLTIFFSTLLVCVELPMLSWLLDVVGATGEAHDVALTFLYIQVPSTPFMAIGMVCSGLLRSTGDARRSMFVTLSAGLVAAVVDPILIFGLDLGVPGAAMAAGLSRIAMLVVGLHGAHRIHDLIGKPERPLFKEDARYLFSLGWPVVLTNLATPFGNGYLIASLATYGDQSVAAMAILSRVIPFAFCGLFALTGSVGPVVGQNFGAGNYVRITKTLTAASQIAVIYTLLVWCVWMFLSSQIILIFDAVGETAQLLEFYAFIVAPIFFFQGMLFIANAGFNTLGKPLISTFFNWLRATAGTIPFVYFGAELGTGKGVLLGHGLGGLVFGVAALGYCYYTVQKAAERATINT